MTDVPICYLDTNAFIDAVEGDAGVSLPMQRFFQASFQGRVSAVTSELTLAEVFAPSRAAGKRLPVTPENKRRYLNLMIWNGGVRLEAVSRSVLLETAKLNVTPEARRVRLPDAIHLVTAIRSEARYFVSNDASIPMPADMMKLDRAAMRGDAWSVSR